MIRFLRRAKTLLVYVFIFHFIRIVADIVLPNAHIFNRIRGFLLGPFFAERGRGLALASGIIINGAWKLRLGDHVYIAHNCWINATGGLTIESGVVISPNVVIATTAHKRVDGAVSLRESKLAPITIGRGTWIASNSVITKGAYLGEGAVVAAGSVVFGDVPSRTLYRGNPAAFVKTFKD